MIRKWEQIILGLTEFTEILSELIVENIINKFFFDFIHFLIKKTLTIFK
jgi:hypothetical protein